ncbi:hypothetical protein ACS0TY_025123 [Phlomoides rotata]
MSETEKRTTKEKSMVAMFKQCAQYLHPLFKFCRKNDCRHGFRGSWRICSCPTHFLILFPKIKAG